MNDVNVQTGWTLTLSLYGVERVDEARGHESLGPVSPLDPVPVGVVAVEHGHALTPLHVEVIFVEGRVGVEDDKPAGRLLKKATKLSHMSQRV